MEDWAAIAAEVDEAIKSVGSTDAGYPASIRREVITGGVPWDPDSGTLTPEYAVVRVIQQNNRVRAEDGSYVASTRRTLTFAATGFAPKKSDTIAPGVDAPDESSPWQPIIEVRPLSPAGADVLYELEIKS
jgi:hypothetical protein